MEFNWKQNIPDLAAIQQRNAKARRQAAQAAEDSVMNGPNAWMVKPFEQNAAAEAEAEAFQNSSQAYNQVMQNQMAKEAQETTDKIERFKQLQQEMEQKKQRLAELQKELGLDIDPDMPIIGIVSRLVSHKGLDLICDVFDQIMEGKCQFAVLGSGDAVYEAFFQQKKDQYGSRMGFFRGYNEALANQIYAGADLLLMPSKSEPCGLAQMIAMRYGTLPIVRETGGLKDTVFAGKNGFTFANYNSADMLYVIREAVDLYHNDPETFQAMGKVGMTTDFSWGRSAEAYNEIYRSICG